MILLDTNLLTRMTRSHDSHAGVARTAVQMLYRRGEQLIVVPQNLYEFWAVATRPPGAPPAGRNGLGMTPVQAGHSPAILSEALHSASRSPRPDRFLAGTGGGP